MNIVTVLIATVIAAVISVVIRKIDRDNNTMEKVKRYADKRQSEFDEYLQEQTKKLASAGAELETTRAQAVAAIKRLEKERDDFLQKADELKNYKNAVAAAEAKITGYDKSLASLSEMTANVEENLNRLKKESLIVEKLDSQLVAQKKNLDALEKRIPHVANEFSQKNGEQLKVLGTKLLEEYDARTQQLKNDIAASGKEADDALAKFKAAVSGVYSSAAQKASELEDVAFKHLSEQAKMRGNEYMKAIDERIDEIEARIDERIAEMEGRVNDRADEVDKTVSELETDFDAKYGDRYAALEEKYDSSLSALTTRLDANMESAQKQIDSRTTLLDGAIDTRTAAIIKKYDAQYAAVADSYKKRTEEYAEKLNEQYAALAAKHAQKAKEADETLASHYTALVEKYKQLSAKTNSSLEVQYSSLFEKYKGKAAELDETLNQKTAEVVSSFKDSTGNVISNIKKNLTSLDEKYKEHIDDFGKKYDEKINSLQEKYTRQLDAIDVKNDSRLDELDNKFENLFTRLNGTYAEKSSALEQQVEAIRAMYDEKEGNVASEISGRIATLNEQYRQQVADIDAQYGQQIAALRTRLEASLAEANETSSFIAQNVSGNSRSIESLQNSLETQIKDVEARYTNLFANAVSQADEKETAMLEKFTSAANTRIEKYHAAIQNKVDSLKSALAETLSSVTHQAQDSVKDAEDAINQIRIECDEAQRRADAIGPKLDEKVQFVDNQIEKFRMQSEAKLVELDKLINDAIRKMAEQCEIQQSDALKALDSQLGSYKKDLAYQFSRLETSGKDIDVLEANLRKAMEEIRKRVLADFDSFTDEQRRQHKMFASTIKEDSDAIETQLEALEQSIDELKQSSVSSVREKLKDFEDSFDDELKVRSDKLNDALSTWKNTFDGRLSLFTGDYEKERRAIEIKYSEDMQAKFNALQERNEEQMSRVALRIQETQNSVQEQLDSISEVVHDFAEETQNRVSKTQTISDEYLKKVSGEYEAKMRGELKKVEDSLLSSLQSFEDGILNRQETSASTIDAALSEFNAWKQHLKQQLDDSSAVFKSQLDALKSSSQNKIGEAQASLLADFEEYSVGIKKQQDAITSSIDALQERAEASLDTYENRAEEILDRLQSMYEDMLKDTEARVSQQSIDAAKTLNGLKEQINAIASENGENQAKFVLKMQNDSNEIQSRMSELNRELQNVKAQMQMYERAEQMKLQLDEKIAYLDDDFGRIAEYGKIAQRLSEQYNAVRKMYDDINARAKEFDAQKTRVETIGQKYDKLIHLSNSMEDKINGLQTSYDALQNMEIAMRDFQERFNALAGSHDRLEQKQEVIERVNSDVDAAFDNLKMLEDRIKQCARDTESLPNEIKAVQKDVDKIIKSGPKLSDAVNKFASLQSLLDEADKRMDALTSARQGIGRSEARLEELKTDIESKFKLLNQLTKKDLEKQTTKREERLSPQDRENIKYLKKQGWTVAEIAKRMKRTQTEIEMVLEMP